MSIYKTIYDPLLGKLKKVFDGSIATFKAGVATVGDLPSSGNTKGDARVTNDTGHLYVWDSSAWQDQGDIIDLNWSAITDKPSSTVVNIDDAVTKKHIQNTDTIIQGSGSPVDQEQDIFSTVTALKVGDGYDSAQTFIANKTGNLVKVKFWAARNNSATERDLIVEIRSIDGDGKPTAVVLATETIASSNFPSTAPAPTWVNYMLTFSSPLAIVTDTKYAIVWRVAQSDGYYHIGDDGVVGDYTRGEYYRTVLGDENWATWFDYNTYFATYVQIDTTDIINNGTLKVDLTVDDLIKIDGRDLSVDGIKLDTIEESSVALATVKADVDIASAISLKHAVVTVAAAPLTLSTQEITFNYDSDDLALDGNNLSIKEDGIKDVHIDWGTGANQISSADIPDHDSHTIRDTFIHIVNRGVAEAITISLTGGLGVSWTVGEIYDRANHTFVSTESGSGNVTNHVVNYLKWVSGTTLTLSTSDATGNEVLIAIGTVYDGNIDGYREMSLLDESLANIRRCARAVFPTRVTSGMSVHEDTDVTNPLDVVMDAGIYCKELQERVTPIEIKSRNTAMVRHFHTASVWDSDTNAQIETTNYDNGTQKTAIPGGKYVKGLFIYMNGKIGFIYPVEYFNTIAQAQDAALPTMPPGLETVPKLTAIVYQQGDTNFTGTIWQDVRAGIGEESFNSVTDHGALAGLSDTADHPYAFLIDGTRAMTGNFDGGAFSLTVNSIEIVGADGEVNKAAVEDSGNWDTAYTHSQLTSGNPHSVTPTELSLVIGTNVQAFDTALNSISGLAYVSDSFIKLTAEDAYSVRTIAEVKSDLSLNNVSNVATDNTAYNATSWDSNSDAATKNVIRDKIETMDTAIGLNTAKATNVSTQLSEGTRNATTYGITSDSGADDIVLPEADTTNAGLLGSDKWDEIVANTSAKHIVNQDTELDSGVVDIDGSDNVTINQNSIASVTSINTGAIVNTLYLKEGNVGVGLVPTTRNNTSLQTVDGIGFPATAVASSDPNTIDDYEEGIYTTTITCSTSGSYTLDANFDILSYTKIGRQVTVTGQITVTGESAPLGIIYVSLPFTCIDLAESSERAIGLIMLYNHGGSIPNGVHSRIIAGRNYFDIIQITDGGVYSEITNAEVDDAWIIYSTITYFVE